jgi:hypothetical protein
VSLVLPLVAEQTYANIIQPETLFNVGKLLMLSGWASKMMDHVSLYGDIEVPPPSAIATLALMQEDINSAWDYQLLDIMVSTCSH